MTSRRAPPAVVGVVIVRQVGAGDHERAAALEHRRQRVAQRVRRLGGLIPHHQRHDRHTRRQALEERQLHFERVLAGVRRGMLTNDGRGGHEPRAHASSMCATPNGVSNPPDATDRHAVEADEVRRSDQHRDVEGPAAQQPVGMRRDRAGVDQARHAARSARRDRRARRGSVRRDAVDGSRQRLRRTRIPAACDRSAPASDVLGRIRTPIFA